MTTQKPVFINISAQRNHLSFIFHLPTETLEYIFIQHARDYYDKNGSHPTPALPSWVNVSYVCRHWRNVALNCATLWTYLFIMSPRWMEELLARSKDAPLKLLLNPDLQSQGSQTRCYVEEVVNHVERIQELCLSLPLVVWETLPYSKLSSPAPSLQYLEIWAPRGTSEWELPSVLFDGDTPVLRTLQLVCCPVAWYSFKLSGLTTLGLYRVPARFQQNTGDLLATLRCMQDLTQLYLHDALASATGFLSSPAFRTFQKFNLPHLSRLSISAPLSMVDAMLSCVNIPLKTEIRLECHFEDGSSPDNLSSLLAKRYNISGGQAPSIPTIRFSAPPTRWGCSIPLQISVKFGESMMENDMDRIICDICCSVPLPNVETVGVVDPPFSSTFWRKVLGHIPKLRYLTLTEGWMPDLASVLSVTPYDDTENEGGCADGVPNQVLAPVLEELELDDIRFSASLPEGVTTNPPAANVQFLLDALSSRKESHGRLSMVECPVHKHDRIDETLDMVGRWEDGHFHIVEESSRPYYNSGSDSDPGWFNSDSEGSNSDPPGL